MKQPEFQIEYDFVTEEIKSLKKRKKTLLKFMEDSGLAVFDGKVREDEKVFGIFYDTTYYSHFDGHLSEAIYDYESGADTFSKETFVELKGLIEKYQEHGDKDGEITEKVSCLDIEVSENILYVRSLLEHFKVIDDNTVRWEYKGDSDQNELCDGSYFEIRMETKSKIMAVKTVDSRYD